MRSCTLLGLVLLGCGVIGCEPRKAAETKKPAATGPKAKVVARIGDRTITVGELEKRLASQKETVRMRFGSIERKKAFLEKLVRFEVLVLEAQRRKLDQHPEVVNRMNQAMVDQLVRDLNKDLVKITDITDAEVEARYERDKEKHQRPAQVRGAQIVVETEAKAKEVHALLQKQPKNPRHFGKLAQEHSVDKQSKGRFGDIGFVDSGDKKNPPEVVKALLALSAPWQVSRPIKVGKRYYILMNAGSRPALNRPLARMRDRIKNQLFHEKRYQAVKAFAAALRKKAKVEIDEAALSKVSARRPPPKLNLPPSQRATTGAK